MHMPWEGDMKYDPKVQLRNFPKMHLDELS